MAPRNKAPTVTNRRTIALSPSSSSSSSSSSSFSPSPIYPRRRSLSQNPTRTTTTTRTTQAATKRCRKMAAPPARLAWPGQISSQATRSLFSQEQENTANKKSTAACSQSIRTTATNQKSTKKVLKRPRSVAEKDDGGCASSLLWIEKHCPSQSSELVVAPKKVKQVSSWLQESNQGLLILVGAPGMGKSTLMRVLAREENIDIVEWTESFYQFQQTAAGDNMEFQTPLQHWQQFIYQSSIGYSSLVVSESSELRDHPSGTMTQQKRRHTQPSSPNTSTTTQKQKRVILLDELPYCHASEQKDKVKESLTKHILHSKIPTVWIWSHNVLEGKQHNPADLEELVDPLVLYNTNVVTFCSVNPPTLARFQSTLKRMAQLEHIVLPSSWIPEMHVKSGGDIRFAIYALQYEFGSPENNNNRMPQQPQKKLGSAENPPNEEGGAKNPFKQRLQNERDVRLSTFHALGKVLYAKRKKDVPENQYIGGEAPLDFNPEAAIEHSGMELSGSIHFIQYHSLDFFTDVSDLSVAWALFSDAAQLLDSSPLHQEDAVSWAAASSLAGRAVSYSNQHPAPTKFRQFTKPKSLDVIAQRKANQWRLDQYYRTAASKRFQHSRQAFAMDIYPYGRRIVEYQATRRRMDGLEDGDWQATTSSFWGGPPLQSFLSTIGGSNSSLTTIMGAANEEEDALKQKEQEEVLAQDDIDDFDDDSF